MTFPHTTPINKGKSNKLQHLNALLDEHVLPYPVRFLTNRIIILATLALLVPLLFFNHDQAFVNALNSYLNVMSVVVSSTVLLYATIADVRDRAAAQHANEIAKSYERVLEERIQERADIAKAYEQKLEKQVKADHELIEQILQNTLENILGGRLEKAQAEEQRQLEALQKVVSANSELLRLELADKVQSASNESLRAELAQLKELVQALQQNHTGDELQ